MPPFPRLLRWLRTLHEGAPTRGGWLDTDYVFGDAMGGRVTKICKAWVTCVLRAHHIEPTWTGTALAADVRARFESIDLHFHDLRHECALRWLEKGYTLSTIASLLGHSNLDTLRVYLGMEQEDAIAEAERINARRVDFGPDEGRAAPKRHQNRGSAPVLPHRPKGGAKGKIASGQ